MQSGMSVRDIAIGVLITTASGFAMNYIGLPARVAALEGQFTKMDAKLDTILGQLTKAK